MSGLCILGHVFFWSSAPVLAWYAEFMLSHQLQVPRDAMWLVPFREYFLPLFIAMFFAAVIGWMAGGVRGPVGSLIRFPPAVYLGTISYGLYVYHQFVVVFLLYVLQTNWIGSRLTYNQYDTIFDNFWLRLAMTVAVASISWHLFEAPLNRLKRFFPYTIRRPADVQAAPA